MIPLAVVRGNALTTLREPSRNSIGTLVPSAATTPLWPPDFHFSVIAWWKYQGEQAGGRRHTTTQQSKDKARYTTAGPLCSVEAAAQRRGIPLVGKVCLRCVRLFLVVFVCVGV